MKLDIKIQQKEEFHCTLNAIYTICQKWEREHALMFADVWDLCFKKENSKTFGESIRPYKNLKIKEHLLYHGVDVERREVTDFDQILREIETQRSEEKIFIAALDAYYCPWYFGFKNNHRDHLCIILDLDSEYIHLLDTFYTFQEERLSLTGLRECLKYYLVVEKKELCAEQIDYLGLVLESLENQRSSVNSMFDAFERFASELATSFDIQEELGGSENMETVEFLFQLKLIASCRRNFASCLTYIAEQTTIDFSQYINELKVVADKWIILRMLFIKSTFKPTYNKQKLVDLVLDIADEEKKLSDELYGYISQRVRR